MKKFLSMILTGFMVFSLVACSSSSKPTEFKPGTYTGTAEGYAGDVVIEVTLTTDKIENVVVVSQNETPDIGGAASEKLVAEIVKTQSIQVDTVTGATLTSNAVIEATTAALKEAGVDASKLEPITTGTNEAIVKDVDVVIVGAGGAGMSAAIEAANAGKTVLIVEKGAITGGNSTRATGGMNAAKTSFQDENEFNENAGVEARIAGAKETYPELSDLIATVEKQYADYQANPVGYFDSTELFMLDTLVGGKNFNNAELVKTLVDNTADSVEWINNLGGNLISVGSFGGASVKRIHKPLNDEGATTAVGPHVVNVLQTNLDTLGVEIITDTEITEILVEDGVVVGVKGDNITVNATSVVIATGGFAANLEMVAELDPSLEGFVTTNSTLITGDGIKMAEAIGAGTVDLDQIQIHPTVEYNSSALITEGLRGDGAILVNTEGKRFADELGTRDVVSAAIIAQPESYAYLIIDQEMVDASAVIQGYITKGFIAAEGDSIEDLAASLNIDGATLAETLTTWNAAVAAGEDAEFGRTSIVKELATGPFYALQVAPGVHHTMGGLAINSNAQVLDTEGNVISGLYAAGEVTGGVHGANRLGGNAVADIIVFGRIAGQQAAANAE